jgi:hypothetical protein
MIIVVRAVDSAAMIHGVCLSCYSDGLLENLHPGSATRPSGAPIIVAAPLQVVQSNPVIIGYSFMVLVLVVLLRSPS